MLWSPTGSRPSRENRTRCTHFRFAQFSSAEGMMSEDDTLERHISVGYRLPCREVSYISIVEIQTMSNRPEEDSPYYDATILCYRLCWNRDYLVF